MVAMAKYSADLYRSAVDCSGTERLSTVGWHQTGSLGLARSEDMWTQLKRACQLLKDYGVPHQLYGPGADRPLAAAAALHPLLALQDENVLRT